MCVFKIGCEFFIFLGSKLNERESIISFVVLFQNLVAKPKIPNC
jgi:hypothetical protein